MKNTTLTFALDIKALAAVRLFACQDDSRWSLCGVCVEIPDAQTVHLVATDGRRLLAVGLATEITGFRQPVTVIIPDRLLEMLPLGRSSKHGDSCGVCLDLHDNGPALATISTQGIAASILCFDAAFPAWRKAVTDSVVEGKELQPAKAGFMAEQVAAFGQASTILAGSTRPAVALWQVEDHLAMHVAGEWGTYNVMALIMPVRISSVCEGKAPKVPAFATTPMPEPTPEPEPKPSLIERIKQGLVKRFPCSPKRKRLTQSPLAPRVERERH